MDQQAKAAGWATEAAEKKRPRYGVMEWRNTVSFYSPTYRLSTMALNPLTVVGEDKKRHTLGSVESLIVSKHAPSSLLRNQMTLL
jgi:hypothetical protein